MKFTDQIKKRRLALGLRQKDMKMRIGMDQQQYQSIESDGNPRLNTLELIAEGLDAELILVPKKKVRAVRKILNDKESKASSIFEAMSEQDDPWSGILDD